MIDKKEKMIDILEKLYDKSTKVIDILKMISDISRKRNGPFRCGQRLLVGHTAELPSPLQLT